MSLKSMLDVRLMLVDSLHAFLNGAERMIISILQLLKAQVVQFKRKNNQEKPNFSRFYGLHYVIVFAFLPYYLFYWIYIYPLFFALNIVLAYISLPMRILCKRSFLMHSMTNHLMEALNICDQIFQKIVSSKVSELLAFCVSTSIEIALALIWPFQFQAQSPPVAEKSISLHELSELVAYEEIDDGDDVMDGHNPHQRRSLRSMHNYIPMKPFRATIRRQQRPSHATSPNQDALASGGDVEDVELAVDSPASFPPTPFSRAYVMNRASERVVSVMFAARDRLRLEAQSVSRDEYSRMAAKEAQSSGQFAVFDPRQTSAGIALTCGNHCAVKVGQGLVCSCRSMVPVRTNAYVYFEFSVTVRSAQEPQLAVGLAPPDCPLNVLVGSWARSVGLYYDGQVMVGSRWFQSPTAEPIVAGSTVGILVYIPFSPTQPNMAAAEEKSNDANESREETQPELVRPSSLSQPPPMPLNSPSHHHAHTMHSPLTTMYPQRDILLNFNVNGKPVQLSSEVEETFREIVSMNAPMYPTVSLFSDNTNCWCRFCEADVVYRSRSAITAPPGVKIYCLDGSLLLGEND